MWWCAKKCILGVDGVGRVVWWMLWCIQNVYFKCGWGVDVVVFKKVYFRCGGGVRWLW